VAIKHIMNAFVSPTDARRIYREIRVMAHLSHPHVLPLRAVLRPRDAVGFHHIYLVSELCETDLHTVVHSRQELGAVHVSYLLYQVLAALAYVHAAGVLHRDIKPANLLVNSDCGLRMCDFGERQEWGSARAGRRYTADRVNGKHSSFTPPPPRPRARVRRDAVSRLHRVRRDALLPRA